MIDVSDELKNTKSNAKLLLQVHDELILECPDNQEEIDKTILLLKNKMENTVKLDIPLKVSIEYGKNWGEFH
jgi:DNA polymerase I